MSNIYRHDRLSPRVVLRSMVASAAEAADQLRPGSDLFGVTMGEWTLAELIEGILAKIGPADVSIAAWTASTSDLTRTQQLLVNGSIRALRFAVDKTFETRQPAFSALLRETFGEGSIRVASCHAKFALLRNESWDVVIRTSMNLSPSHQLNLYEIRESKPMADWLESAIGEVFSAPPRANQSERSLFLSDEPLGTDVRRAGLTYS